MESPFDDSTRLGGSGDAPPPPPAPAPTPAETSESGGAEDEAAKKEEEELMEKAQRLMDKITASADNPNATVIHALASLLETQESLYIKENSLTNTRASHNIGRLANLVRENDEFFELVSSRFLSESRYSASVQAASARLLNSCSLTWLYPHVFEEPVMENVRSWVMNGIGRSSSEDRKHDNVRKEPSDSEMLRTYATGLLAVCLAGGGQVVEDVLTSGLPAKLMRYLRIRVLGEMSASQKDANYSMESKNISTSACGRGKEEVRGRARQVPESSLVDNLRTADERSLDESNVARDHNRTGGEKYWVNGGEPLDVLAEGLDTVEADGDSGNGWQGQDLHDGKTRFGDLDEGGRDETSRCKAYRARSKGKGRASEANVDGDQILTSPVSGNRSGHGRSTRDRSVTRTLDAKKELDTRKYHGATSLEGVALERSENDDCFQGCRVGTKDISHLVKEAVGAAEAEARAANAPAEAIRAAGDAAAEVVKSAAIEEFKSSNNEEAAISAASIAVSTVIDAANVVEVSRNLINTKSTSEDFGSAEAETNEVAEEYFIPDFDTLAQLREKYCIQCLEILGEYVEVLGPVLHEKGVDVSLALLQRSCKNKELARGSSLLPDIMKLICALAAHRKFAALFVDRGGMQKLLTVPRNEKTYFGLSSCLFTLGSLQAIMERVCALPSDVVYQVVELAIQLLDSTQDQARKNSALFFGAAFVFRAVIDGFDAQDGLQKLLDVLKEAAAVRSGVNSNTLNMSAASSLRNDRSPAEVLTSSGKQIAYHTCVALRQYFRAHLLLLIESIRPSKSNRGGARIAPSIRSAYKPLDITNEAMETVFLQLQMDRKLGTAFVRTRFPAVDKFLASNGHITMLELCQAPPVDRYLHDLLQYALGVLHIVTLVNDSRKLIVNATLSNNRPAIAVVLDAANIASNYVDPEIIQPALNVLINLVCPPASLSNKPPPVAQGMQATSSQSANAASETRDRNIERNLSDRAMQGQTQLEQRERNAESNAGDRSSASASATRLVGSSPQVSAPPAASGLVGDRRISLGPGAGCAGLATQIEQGYRQAREAVRANNGIKVLLHLLQPRIYSPPATLDCIRALACRVLLGLARDETIAHILTKLQVGKKLSELIRDSGNQTPGSEQGRWQAELAQVAIELIAIVTNSGRASTLAATDAATPTLKRIERAAIAAATPITYHSRELLLLLHEHLQASGLVTTAAALLKEAQLTPLPSLAAASSLAHQACTQENTQVQIQWPSGRTPSGFLSEKLKPSARLEDSAPRIEPTTSSKNKSLLFSPSFGSYSRSQSFSRDSNRLSSKKVSIKQLSTPANVSEPPSGSLPKNNADADSHCKTPIVLPMKRKLSELKDVVSVSSTKRFNGGDHGLRSPICLTPNSGRKSGLLNDALGFSTPSSRDLHGRSTPSNVVDLADDNQASNSERLTLDSIVVQYLKHQHRQCPAPITTLPPLSLLQPHVCPEPKRSLDAPANVTSRLGTREFKSVYGGVYGNRRDRQFVYSRFRPWRTCRDDAGALLTCMSFVGDSSHIAVGSHAGELKIFDTNSNSVLETCTNHQSPLTLVQSHRSGETPLLLSSSSQDVRLWDASSISGGPMHSLDGCKAARFSNCGNLFAVLTTDSAQREILLYDVQTCRKESTLQDIRSSSPGRGQAYSLIHFSPSDTMLLWNGVLWDRRQAGPVHHFDQFTDYGGGGFHPAGNEVIINSEVWDLRKFRLLRSVPSLDQTAITFNAQGDVIYAILRRNLDDVMSAVNTRRVKQPLFAAFRTIDAINYSDIATIPVDRCVLDFATEATDSFVGLITMDDQDEMYSSARVYEIGRRRPTDDDSDPDDAESEEDEEDEDEDDVDVDPLLGGDLDDDDDGDSEGDDMSNDEEDSLTDMDDEDGDFMMDDGDFDGGRLLEIVAEGEEEEDDSQDLESFGSEEDEDYEGDDFNY